MSYRIWFAPTAPSHVNKLRLLLSALAQRGDEVRMLCADAVMKSNEQVGEQARNSGLPCEVLPAVCPPEPHPLTQPWHTRRLRKTVRELLKRNQVDLLIMASVFGPMRRAMLAGARDAGVATMHVGDGLLQPANPRYHFKVFRRRKLGWSLVQGLAIRAGLVPPPGRSPADRVVIMNRSGRDMLISQGVSPGAIRVVGSDEYDALFQSQAKVNEAAVNQQVRERLGITGERPIVLYAAQSFDHQRLISDMMPAIKRCQATLLVKFHPRQMGDPQFWKDWAAQQGYTERDILFFGKELTSIEAVRLCSVCMTVFSTVGLEAMVIRRPVVLAQYLEARLALPYGQQGAMWDAEDPEGLRKGLETLLTDQAARRQMLARADAAIREELLGLDGQSLNRMVQAVDELLGEREVLAPRRGRTTGRVD